MQSILSWNAPLSIVQVGTAPRGCLGYSLSLDIARRTVEHFRPTTEAQLKAAADDAAAAERAARELSIESAAEDVMSTVLIVSQFDFMSFSYILLWIFCCLCIAIVIGTKQRCSFLEKCLEWFAKFQVLAYVSLCFDIKGAFLICVMCSGCCCVYAHAKIRAVTISNLHPLEEVAVRWTCNVVAIITSLSVVCIRALLYDSYSTRSYFNIIYAFFIPCVFLFMYVCNKRPLIFILSFPLPL